MGQSLHRASFHRDDPLPFDPSVFRERGELGLLGPVFVVRAKVGEGQVMKGRSACCACYEGTRDVHALVLGRAISGIAAFAN